MRDPWHNWFFIYSAISDHDNHRVGVRLRSQSTAHLGFEGNVSNTFTGDMEVDGFHLLSLNKVNGAIAIQKGLILRNKAQLHIGYTGQFGRQATVKLNNASFGFWGMSGDNRKEVFHQLVVTGESELNFHAGGYYAKGVIYLDDLLVFDLSSLLIKGWIKNGEHLLLVRKDSKNLWKSLSRIKFEGSASWEWKAGVEDYNSDYWQIIPGFPEPSTYGAIFGGLGVLFTLSRNRRCLWRTKSHFRSERKE